MKNIFPVVLTILLMMFVACKKQNNTSKNGGDGYWTLGQKQYNITTSERTTTSGYFLLSGFDTTVPSNSINFYFPLVPSVSGKYKVVPFRENIALNARELGIKLNIPSTGIYSSTGTADSRSWIIADSADVNVSGEKITVRVPQMCTIIITSTYLDSVFLKAVVIEK